MAKPKPKVYSLTVANDGLLSAPAWEESTDRGKNWLAVIDVDPSSPGGLSRDFLPRGRGECLYNVERLALFDAVEFAGDYTTGTGKTYRNRWYGVVVAKTDSHVHVEQASSGAQAVLRARDAKVSTADRLRALKADLEASEAKTASIRAEMETLSAASS